MSATADSITTFARDPATGVLTYGSCIADSGANGCTNPTHQSLDNPDAVAVSPDGMNVYVVSFVSNSISRFASTNPGTLAYKGCTANGGAHGCTAAAHPSLGGPEGVAVSHDGTSVYVASLSGTVTRLARNESTGTLTYKGCIANGGADGCFDPALDALTAAGDVTVSPDDESVYVTADSGIVAFNRHTDTGGLHGEACIADGGLNGCATPAHDSFQAVRGVVVSPDGRSVYVANGSANGGVTTLKRSSSGALTYQSCVLDGGGEGCATPDHDSMGSALRFAASADGRSLYLASVGSDSITTFKRSRSSGQLTYKSCVADGGAFGCDDPPLDSLGGAQAVAVGPEDATVYATAFDGNSVTTLARRLAAPQTSIHKLSTVIYPHLHKARFAFDSDEPDSTFKCKMDHHGYKPCSGITLYKHLDSGKHKFKVKATNSQGKTDPTAAKKKFKID